MPPRNRLNRDSRRRTTVTRTARSGNNQFTAAREQGGTSFSASGRTRAQAYSRLRRGMGVNGG